MFRLDRFQVRPCSAPRGNKTNLVKEAKDRDTEINIATGERSIYIYVDTACAM
jgi:hypothetical protein